MDTPAFPAPVDPREQTILDELLRIRDSLLLLRKDKSSYIRTVDVLHYFEDVNTQVEQLSDVRKDEDRRLVNSLC